MRGVTKVLLKEKKKVKTLTEDTKSSPVAPKHTTELNTVKPQSTKDHHSEAAPHRDSSSFIIQY